MKRICGLIARPNGGRCVGKDRIYGVVEEVPLGGVLLTKAGERLAQGRECNSSFIGRNCPSIRGFAATQDETERTFSTAPLQNRRRPWLFCRGRMVCRTYMSDMQLHIHRTESRHQDCFNNPPYLQPRRVISGKQRGAAGTGRGLFLQASLENGSVDCPGA